MKFRTEYQAEKITGLDPRRRVVLIGSCFSDNIGCKMRRSLWKALVNPCGTLFNPVSISNAILSALEKRACSDYFLDGEVWKSWDFPSAFAGTDKEELEGKSIEALSLLNSYLHSSQAIIVTFGSAIVYCLAAEPDRIVANCHKFPANQFRRRMLSPEEIIQLWRDTIGCLREINPGIKVVFTVSPVRHIKEGFTENSLSKATLILAVREICNEIDNCFYFPAFEIVNDDLRDYRFYTSDLVHPSEECVDYVWEKFRLSFLSDENQKILDEGKNLSLRFSHRPLIAGTAAEKDFKKQTLRMAEEFKLRYPEMLNPLKL